MMAKMLAFEIASIRALCGLFVRFLQKVANLWYDCGDFDLRNRVFLTSVSSFVPNALYAGLEI